MKVPGEPFRYIDETSHCSELYCVECLKKEQTRAAAKNRSVSHVVSNERMALEERRKKLAFGMWFTKMRAVDLSRFTAAELDELERAIDSSEAQRGSWYDYCKSNGYPPDGLMAG